VTRRLPSSEPNIKDVDRLIHEPSRLMLMAQLYVVQSADFTFLLHQTEMTPGNLSAHLSKLEKAGYIEVTKEFIERKPHTALALTKKGRYAFKQYRRDIKQIAERLPE
jgi:DNA-binding MarR family transcriptional regulator